MNELILFLTFLLAPLVIPMTVTSGSGRRRSERPWLNPEQASAVDAAVARVLAEEEPGLSGNMIRLPCCECGAREIPPAEVGDSPWLPVELVTLVAAEPPDDGWRIVATCTACGSPLVSRVLGDDLADHCLTIGVVPAFDLVREDR